MSDSQRHRVLQHSRTRKIVESIRDHASRKHNAKISVCATLPNGQSAVLYLPKEKHLRSAANVPTNSDFWTKTRSNFKGKTDDDINAEMSLLKSNRQTSVPPFRSIHPEDPDLKYTSTLHLEGMYTVLKALAADYQGKTGDTESTLGFYSQGWTTLKAEHCNASHDEQVEQAIFNWQLKARKVKADAVSEVRIALHEVLLDPVSIVLDPHNGMACIASVLHVINEKPKVKELYPDGIEAIDLAFMAIRQTIISGRVPWFVVASIDDRKLHSAIQGNYYEDSCNIISIRLPHVGTAQKILYEPSCLLPSYKINARRGDYIFILINLNEAARRLKNASITSRTDLYSWKLPDSKDMAEVQHFKETPETIDCVMIVSSEDISKMAPAPFSYIGGHHIGWIEWRFDPDTVVEKLPSNLWQLILRYEQGYWYQAWSRRTLEANKYEETFTPTPCSTIRSLKACRTRTIVLQGQQLCSCGAPISDILRIKCQSCGRIITTTIDRQYLAGELFTQQEIWLRQFNNVVRQVGKQTMSQHQLVSRMVSKIQGPTSLLALTNLPYDAGRPTIQQAILLMALVRAVVNQDHYYNTLKTQERIACATKGRVEHYCIDRHAEKAYHYVDSSTTYYDPHMLNAIRYPDLHPQVQAKNFSPSVEKVVTGPLMDLGLAERAFGVVDMAAFDPVLIHNAPRRNTVVRIGGPIGPYAVGENTPYEELPDDAPPYNKDIRRATSAEIQHYLDVEGRNVTYMTMMVLFNSLKRIVHYEGKRTIWETSWINNVLNRLYDSHIIVNVHVPELQRFNLTTRDSKVRMHMAELSQYAAPTSSTDAIINAAMELQRNIDQHQWLDESTNFIYRCPESELRSHRRDLYNWYLPLSPTIQTHSRDARCYPIRGGWTHNMRHSLTRYRYNNVSQKFEPTYRKSRKRKDR